MWEQSKEEQLNNYFTNLNRNLEQAETYEEYIVISRRLCLMEHQRECQTIRAKISRNTRCIRGKGDPIQRRRREDVQRYFALLTIPVLQIKNSGPMVMSDNRTGEKWYHSFASKHPTNLKVNFT